MHRAHFQQGMKQRAGFRLMGEKDQDLPGFLGIRAGCEGHLLSPPHFGSGDCLHSAGNLIYTLTLRYNKARQQSITSVMLDIAGGAEAMRQAARAQIQARLRVGASR